MVRHLDYLFLEAFYESVSQGDDVADVGAFMGTYSILASLRAGPMGHVYAFEPSSQSCASIARNLRWNGLDDRITVCECAVSDRDGEAELLSTSPSSTVPSSTNSFFLPALGGDARSTREIFRQSVRTVDLDSFFATRGRDPAVVKIDVEGAELAVLQGASRILAGGAVVFCELHPYAWDAAGHSSHDLTSWLHERGREIVDLRTGDVAVAPYRYGPFLLRPIVRSD